MTIYLEPFAAVNWAMDYLLLWAVASVAGVRVSCVRLALAATAGAAYAVGWALFPAAPPFAPPVALLFSVVLVWLAFRPVRDQAQFLRLLGLFFALGLAAVGTGLSLWTVGRGGDWGSALPQFMSGVGVGRTALAAALSVVLSGGLASWALRRLRQAPWRVGVEVDWAGRTVSLTGLVDTGHLARDPETGQPLVLVEALAVADLLEADLADGARPVAVRALGGRRVPLAVVEVQGLRLKPATGGPVIPVEPPPLVGLLPGRTTLAGDCQALIPPDVAARLGLVAAGKEEPDLERSWHAVARLIGRPDTRR